MTVDVSPRVLSSPESWGRYFAVNVDLEPLRGTPGLEADTVELADLRFVRATDRGHFRRVEKSAPVDAAQIGAALAPGELAGVQRRQVRLTRCGTHVALQQLVRGAPVVGGELRVHDGPDGVFALTGRPLGDLEARDPGPAPRFDQAEALSTCSERFELGGPPAGGRVRQVVFPDGDGATWAYEVAFVVPDDAADVRIFLRAETFDTLLSYNVAAAAQARVYPVNPRRTPDLEDVELAAPDDVLRGPVLDVAPAQGTRLERDAGDFRLEPDEEAFDEPNAYHHLTRGLEYFRSICAPGLLDASPFAPLPAVVRDRRYPDNAYFFPTTGRLHFGIFGGERSGARSASILIHELAHAVTDTISGLGQSYTENDEARGLAEGFSDYFAASLLDDPRFGDYVAEAQDGWRNCARADLRFPDGFTGDPHETGSVWAGVLWSIRAAEGREGADRLAIESVEFLDRNSTFEEARLALHVVDEQLYGDTHRELIDREFDARVA